MQLAIKWNVSDDCMPHEVVLLTLWAFISSIAMRRPALQLTPRMRVNVDNALLFLRGKIY